MEYISSLWSEAEGKLYTSLHRRVLKLQNLENHGEDPKAPELFQGWYCDSYPPVVL